MYGINEERVLANIRQAEDMEIVTAQMIVLSDIALSLAVIADRLSDG